MSGHIPVLLEECIKYLNIKPDGIYVDGTLGMGGHSEAILQRLTTGRLISIDRDTYAIERATERLAPYADRLTIVHGNFRDLPEILDEQGVDLVDGMLFDLGVSSPQLDEGGRGFSYMVDAPLDMRMDKSDNIDAWFIVNRWPEVRSTAPERTFSVQKFIEKPLAISWGAKYNISTCVGQSGE